MLIRAGGKPILLAGTALLCAMLMLQSTVWSTVCMHACKYCTALFACELRHQWGRQAVLRGLSLRDPRFLCAMMSIGETSNLAKSQLERSGASLAKLGRWKVARCSLSGLPSSSVSLFEWAAGRWLVARSRPSLGSCQQTWAMGYDGMIWPENLRLSQADRINNHTLTFEARMLCMGLWGVGLTFKWSTSTPCYHGSISTEAACAMGRVALLKSFPGTAQDFGKTYV